jgi:imidazole glycerol-phosphate synthase subunit HisH
MNDLAIIDYGMGNLQSIVNAVEYLGDCNPVITSDQEVIKVAKGIILPGVGAFGDAMDELHKRNLVEILNEEVCVKKKPILGICLGMQLLFESSEENNEKSGLSWIKGQVKKFDSSSEFRVPHVGWNELSFAKTNKLFNNIDYDKNFYFVHSYFVNTNKENVIATSNYGVDFVSAVKKDNIYGTQFHPEKSHFNGLTLLKNFFQIIMDK